MPMMCRPHHPWELLTGSLDASVKRWNFSQGRAVRHWRVEPTEEHNSSQVTTVHRSTPQTLNMDVISHSASKCSPPLEAQQASGLLASVSLPPT